MAMCDCYYQHGLKFLCYGTKEMEECSCGGDESKCNFYPEKRKQKKEGRQMNKIPYEERVKTYTNALITYGDEKQMIVALEELSECQKEICKILRGGEDFSHLAEEIADAAIMLEQMCLAFGLEDSVYEHMNRKVMRLGDNLKKHFPVENA